MGGKREGRGHHQLVWSAWGERAVIGFRGLEAEVIGGGAGERERENGKMEMGPRRKGLRHSTTAGLARSLGLELAGWAGAGLGWTDVELELGPVDEAGRLQSGVASPFAALHIHPTRVCSQYRCQCLVRLGSSGKEGAAGYGHSLNTQSLAAGPTRSNRCRSRGPRPKNQDPRQRPSKTQASSDEVLSPPAHER